MTNNIVSKNIAKLPLSVILIAPLIVQISAVVGLSGYLLSRNNDTDGERSSKNANAVMVLCLGALGVSSAWGFYTSKLITKPIVKLKSVADAIASGELEQNIEVDGTKEIQALAESFNIMSQDLKKSFGYLENVNEELESRVEETSVELHSIKEDLAKARSSAQPQNSLLNSVGIQMRDPLNGILDRAQNLQTSLAEFDREIGEDKQSNIVADLQAIEQQSNVLLSSLNGMVDLAQLESDRIKLRFGNVNFPYLLKEIVSKTKSHAKAKDIEFNYETTGKMPSGINADSKRLEQLLTSLLTQALESTKQGKISFRISEIKHIPAESAELLPQKVMRFEIVKSGEITNDTNESSSINLALSEKILVLMNSELQINSQAKGSMYWFDATFSVTDGMREVKQNDVSEMLNTRGKKHKILIVDDIEENRNLLIDILEPMGFELFIATNGREGIEVACKRRPDLILTDLFMGVKTGFSMVEELRQMPTFVNLPIIAISASSFEVVEQKSKESGCDAFLQKPFNQNDLLALLVQYLQLEWTEPETSFL